MPVALSLLTRPGGINDIADRSTGDRSKSLVFLQGGMGRTVRGSMEAVCGELRELRLRGGPACLLPDIGREDSERFPVQARERLRLIEDRPQLGELGVVGSQLAGLRGERS